jgi:hypothetical protein
MKNLKNFKFLFGFALALSLILAACQTDSSPQTTPFEGTWKWQAEGIDAALCVYFFKGNDYTYSERGVVKESGTFSYDKDNIKFTYIDALSNQSVTTTPARYTLTSTTFKLSFSPTFTKE